MKVPTIFKNINKTVGNFIYIVHGKEKNSSDISSHLDFFLSELCQGIVSLYDIYNAITHRKEPFVILIE